MRRIGYISKPAFSWDAYGVEDNLMKYIGQDNNQAYAFRMKFEGTRKYFIVNVYNINTKQYLKTEYITSKMGLIPALPSLT